MTDIEALDILRELRHRFPTSGDEAAAYHGPGFLLIPEQDALDYVLGEIERRLESGPISDVLDAFTHTQF